MNVLIVTSESNPQIREMAALLTPRGRRGTDYFIAEGFRVVREAALAGLPIERLAVQNEFIEDDRVRELLKMERLQTMPVLKVPRMLIKMLSSVETPQGIVAQIRRPHAQPAEPPADALSIACELIQDPRNLGMLARAAHAAGVKHIYLGDGSVDFLHPQAVNSSAGSLFHIQTHTGQEMKPLVTAARKSGVKIWATAAEGGTPLPDAAKNSTGGVMLLFGNEGAGLSPELQKLADTRITIPMPGGAESLNIAVAAAVIMFHLNMSKSGK